MGVGSSRSASASALPDMCYILDAKVSGTDGGNASADTVTTRDLNIINTNGSVTNGSCEWCSLDSNQFTLNAGKYKIKVKTISLYTEETQAFLYNVTDTSYDLESINSYGGLVHHTECEFDGYLDIDESKTYEVRMYTTNAVAGYGLGASSDGTSSPQTKDIYTKVVIERF